MLTKNKNYKVEVSIIIINYNGRNLLKNCLSSLYKLTKDVNFEVILIDNNSSESIEDIISPYQNLIFIKNKKNLGFAAANNQGLKLAKGKYILFLNNDTVFIENSIKKIYDFAESFEKEVFVGCQLLNSDGSKQESTSQFPSIWNTFTESFFLYKLFSRSKYFNKYYLNYIDIKEPVEVDVIKGAFMFCSKDALRKLEGFDENFFFYSEEIDLCYRFKKNGGLIYFYPLTSIYHVERASASKNEKFLYKNLIYGKIKYFRKHFSGISYFLITFLTYIGIFIRIFFYFVGGLILFKKELIIKSGSFITQLISFPEK